METHVSAELLSSSSEFEGKAKRRIQFMAGKEGGENKMVERLE